MKVVKSVDNVTQHIVAGAAVVSAIGVIITAIVTCYKLIRKWDKWVEKKDKHDIEQYKDILRIKIMMPEMPLSERIAAGDIYVNTLHENGGVKQKYLELLQRFSEEYKE